MPDNQLYTQESALRKSALLIAGLANSKLRLIQGAFVVGAFTTKAQMVASEATFDGYPAGGYPLAAWTGPLIATGGGAIETSPLVNIAYGPAGDPPVGNSISGWWIEDATGNVRTAGNYDPPRSASQVGDGWSFVDQIIEAKNPVAGPSE
jgi:hypothetical protein